MPTSLPYTDVFQAQVERYIELARTQFSSSIRVPTIGFRKAGKTGGSAHLQRNHINFNPHFIDDNYDHYMTHVIPHEVAHIVCYQLFGRVKPHGKEWQSMMTKVFNAEPHVTHSMTSERAVSRTFTYQCDCGPVELSVRRHNKVERGQQEYQCRTCGARLKPVFGEDSI